MKTSRPVKRKKTAIETIRWKRVLLIPFIVAIIAGGSIGAFYLYNQNNLAALQKRIAQQEAELQEYLLNNKDQLIVNAAINEADRFGLQYDYEKAISILKSNAEIQSNDKIVGRIASYQKAMAELVAYTDMIPVLFFHNLVNDPKIAFGKTSHDPFGYKSRNVTKTEFKLIIEQMYERGYVLVNFDDVYTISNGTYLRREVKLPVGKKPFVLTVDEVAYPDPMPLDGFARGMVIRDGKILSRVLVSDGVDYVDDGDVVPIIEKFLEEHPDFSYKGARGLLSLTGYAGTLGYRLLSTEEVNEAKALAAQLLERGWIFGCTSYADIESVYAEDADPVKITADLKKWDQKIQPIVGNTTYFINPSGYRLTGKSLAAIRNSGYDTYFTVANQTSLAISEGMVFVSRIMIGGSAFTENKAYLEANFFDVESILDPAR